MQSGAALPPSPTSAPATAIALTCSFPVAAAHYYNGLRERYNIVKYRQLVLFFRSFHPTL